MPSERSEPRYLNPYSAMACKPSGLAQCVTLVREDKQVAISGVCAVPDALCSSAYELARSSGC